MSTLEERLKQKLIDEEQEKNEKKRREEERKKQEQLQANSFYPFVKEAIDEFVILAKKYYAPTEMISLYKKTLFGGKPTFKKVKVWGLPSGNYSVDEKGVFYTFDKTVQYGPLNYYTEYTHKKISREEVIEGICRYFYPYSNRFSNDQSKAREEMKEYVQNEFLKKLAIH